MGVVGAQSWTMEGAAGWAEVGGRREGLGSTWFRGEGTSEAGAEGRIHARGKGPEAVGLAAGR